jgi:hypothetical protein
MLGRPPALTGGKVNFVSNNNFPTAGSLTTDRGAVRSTQVSGEASNSLKRGGGSIKPPVLSEEMAERLLRMFDNLDAKVPPPTFAVDFNHQYRLMGDDEWVSEHLRHKAHHYPFVRPAAARSVHLRLKERFGPDYAARAVRNNPVAWSKLEPLVKMGFREEHRVSVDSIGSVVISGPSGEHHYFPPHPAKFVQDLMTTASEYGFRLTYTSGAVGQSGILRLVLPEVQHEGHLADVRSQVGGLTDRVTRTLGLGLDCQLFVTGTNSVVGVYNYSSGVSSVQELFSWYAGYYEVPYDVVCDSISFLSCGKRITFSQSDDILSNLVPNGVSASAQLLIVGGRKKKKGISVQSISRAVLKATKSKTGKKIGSVARMGARMVVGKDVASLGEKLAVSSLQSLAGGPKRYKEVSGGYVAMSFTDNSMRVLLAATDSFNSIYDGIYIGTGPAAMSNRVTGTIKGGTFTTGNGQMFISMAPCVSSDGITVFSTGSTGSVTSLSPYTNVASPAISTGWSVAATTNLPFTAAQLYPPGSPPNISFGTDYPVGRVVMACLEIQNTSATVNVGGITTEFVPNTSMNLYGATLADITSQRDVNRGSVGRQTAKVVVFPTSASENTFELDEVVTNMINSDGSSLYAQSAALYPLSGGTTISPNNNTLNIGGQIATIAYNGPEATFTFRYVVYVEYVGVTGSVYNKPKTSDTADWSLCTQVLRQYQNLLQEHPGADEVETMRLAVHAVGRLVHKVPVGGRFGL